MGAEDAQEGNGANRKLATFHGGDLANRRPGSCRHLFFAPKRMTGKSSWLSRPDGIAKPAYYLARSTKGFAMLLGQPLLLPTESGELEKPSRAPTSARRDQQATWDHQRVRCGNDGPLLVAPGLLPGASGGFRSRAGRRPDGIALARRQSFEHRDGLTRGCPDTATAKAAASIASDVSWQPWISYRSRSRRIGRSADDKLG